MTKEQKIEATGRLVAQLQKGKTVNFINPVAIERAQIMKKYFFYNPFVVDDYTLKPNNYTL